METLDTSHTHTHTQLINEVNIVAGYKTNIQKSKVIKPKKKLLKKEIKKVNSFMIISKNNYKLKEIKDHKYILISVNGKNE